MWNGTQKRLLFREVNKAIREMSRGLELPAYLLFCECEQGACGARIETRAALYEEVLSAENTFVVVPGHQNGASDKATFIPVVGSPGRANTLPAPDGQAREGWSGG
jgi:hypothetical protein